MGKLVSLEQKIVAEYGIIKGWIATNAYAAVGIALAVGVTIGHFVR